VVNEVNIKSFLESTPIGVQKNLVYRRKIRVTSKAIPGQTSRVDKRESKPDHIRLHLPRIRLFCDGECTGERQFDPVDAPYSSNYGPAILIQSAQNTNLFVVYRCGDCKQEIKRFALNLNCPENAITELATEKEWQFDYQLQKIGEVPKPTTPLNKKVKKLISNDWELYRKGADDEAAGNGIGAFAYYRRVVENSRDAIVDAICKAMEKLEVPPENIQKVAESKNTKQFSNSVDEIGKFIPADLHVAGKNPLTALYQPLSDGIHNKSDAECLELAAYVRIVLDAFGQKLQTVLDDHDKVQEALKKLGEFR
jgi:hypothetical protein